MIRATSSSSWFIFGDRRSIAGTAAIALAGFGFACAVQAADVTWNNGASNFTWDTLSLNWSSGAWNNANGDGAIFGASGVGALNLMGPISVNSLSFTADGYSLTGAGPLNIVSGTSTQTTGVVNVATGATAKIFVPINSSLGFQKIGAGTLELNSPCSFFGGVGLDARNTLQSDLLVGSSTGIIPSGILRINGSNVLAPSTRVSLSDGLMDIGNNNVTVSQLTFTNQNDFVAWNPAINAAGCGVIGSGTLRVTGEINVIGVAGGNSGSNTIAANLDLGGGTQVVRTTQQGSAGLYSSLQFTGSLSNGSLLKAYGTTFNGVQGQADGIGLFGNNTYTGSTRLNGGFNVITGTNATTSVEVAGSSTGGSLISLQGANGSLQSATTLKAYSGSSIILDNNAALASGNSSPTVPAAQNNDRIRDDAQVQLRDGNFTYRGLSTGAASETFGSLAVQGGHNIFTITPNGTGGTATVTVAGDLTMDPRATLQVAGTTLGAAGKVFVNGNLPTADATGILPHMVGSSDFLTYNGATGLTPFSAYSVNTFAPGTNVSVNAASTVNSSVNINALKRGTSSFTTTIASGQTLGISSGMILNAGGTGTYTGGTIDFAANPGVFFSGTSVVNSAITGSSGLINPNSTLTLNGDLSGLSGTLSTYSGTTTLATNTFAGPLEVRTGTLNINTSQTLVGQGPIKLGVPQNDADFVPLNPTLSISGAGANAVIARDIIVDNGATNAAGVPLRYSLVPGITPVSNSTGSQTFSGNVTLNTSVRLSGGGASSSSTGSTNFTGSISGPGTFHVSNGRVNFAGNVSNSGGFNLGDQGFTVKATFSGTGSGNGPVTISGGNSNTLSYTNGALPGGPLNVWNSSAGSAPTIIPLDNSTIYNQIVLGIGPNPGQEGNAIVNTGAGISAEWAGPITGFSPLTKTGTGSLKLSSSASTYTGSIADNAGILRVTGSLPAASVSVASAADLAGSGSVGGSVVVAAGGSVDPGNSIGALGVGNLSMSGALNEEIDLNSTFGPQGADLVNVTGTISLSNATLNLLAINPSGSPGGTFIIAANDGTDPVTGTFASIGGLPAGWLATVDYAFNGVDALGRIGTGNDIAVTLTPEPSSLLLLGLGTALLARRRR